MAHVELRTALLHRYVEGVSREKVATRELQSEIVEVVLQLAGLEQVLQAPEALQRLLDLLERGLMYGTGQPLEAVRKFAGVLQRNDAAQRYKQAMREAGVTNQPDSRAGGLRSAGLQARGTRQTGYAVNRPQCPTALWQTLNDQQRKLWLDATRRRSQNQ